MSKEVIVYVMSAINEVMLMPEGAVILGVRERDNEIVLDVLINPLEKQMSNRNIYRTPAYNTFDDSPGIEKYIGMLDRRHVGFREYFFEMSSL